MNDNCLFCKIITGVIPSSEIYEDDEFFAFLDINPVVKGHTLLVPKSHFEWIHETPDEVIARAFTTTKILIQTMREKLPCDYVQVSVVGKDVPHFHIHLIPRMLGDGLPQFPTTTYDSTEEMNQMALKLKTPHQ